MKDHAPQNSIELAYFLVVCPPVDDSTLPLVAQRLRRRLAVQRLRRTPGHTNSSTGLSGSYFVDLELLRGLRSGRLEKIATNQPESGGTVQHAAPVDMNLRTVSHDEAIIDLAGTRPLRLSSAQIEQVKKATTNRTAL